MNNGNLKASIRAIILDYGWAFFLSNFIINTVALSLFMLGFLGKFIGLFGTHHFLAIIIIVTLPLLCQGLFMAYTLTVHNERPFHIGFAFSIMATWLIVSWLVNLLAGPFVYFWIQMAISTIFCFVTGLVIAALFYPVNVKEIQKAA